MLQIKVKPIDEHNLEGVLELLNSHKSKLSILLLQYNTIIEIYLKILGISGLGLANVNEVILPEIESLLNKYNCEFTEKGIYSNGKAILSVSLNTPTIKIENGENYCEISKEIVNEQKGLFVKKEIRDFSNLDKNVKENFSEYAMTQLDTNTILNQKPSFSHPLKKIHIITVIAEEIELLKKEEEFYKVCDEDDICVMQLFRLSVSGPTIHYKLMIDIPDSIKTETLYERAMILKRTILKEGPLEEVKKVGPYKYVKKDLLEHEISELEEIESILGKRLYSQIEEPHTNSHIDTELFYYGESKLHYNPNNRIHKPVGDNPFRREGRMHAPTIGYEEQISIVKEIPIISFWRNHPEKNAKLYDVINLLGYSKLIDNIGTYDKKYPNDIHPLYSYMRNWKSDLGIFIRNYISDISDLSKTPDD